MQILPMDLPAEIHRWADEDASELPRRCEITVARGPLIIMAYGLMAIDPAEREGFWITSAMGDLTPGEAEEALRRWNAH